MLDITTESVLTKEWKNPAHNFTLNINDNNYISFSPSLTEPWAGTALAQDTAGGETALCTLIPWKCLILNGDFRKAYEDVVDQGYDACYKVFQDNKAEHGSSWSDE